MVRSLHNVLCRACVVLTNRISDEGKDKEAESAEEEKEVKAPLPPALQEQIERPSEDFHGLLGYLLGWSLVLDHCTLRSPEFRARLGSYLRRSSFSLQMFMRVLCQHLDLQHPHASTSLPPPQSFKIAGTSHHRHRACRAVPCRAVSCRACVG